MVWARLAAHAPVQLAQLIAGFGAVALFSRLLSPEDYGRYGLVMTTMLMVHTIAFSWVEAAAFRFLPRARQDGRTADHFATLLVIAAGAMALAAAAAAALVLALSLDRALWAAAGLAAGAALLRLLLKIAREGERAEGRTLAYGLAECAYVLGGFGLGAGLTAAYGATLGPAGPFIGLVVVGAALAARDAPGLLGAAAGGRVCRDLARGYIAYGLPLAAALGLELMVQTAARFVLAAELGPAAIGAYFAASALAWRMIDIVFLWTGASGAPVLLAAYEREGSAGAMAAGARQAGMMLALAAPAAIGLVLVAQPLAEVMIGPELRAEALPLIPWIVLAASLQGFATHYVSEAFQLSRRTGLRAALMIIPAAAALGFAALLTPIWGLAGAAWALAGAAGLGLIALIIASRRVLALPIPYGEAAKAFLAAAAMIPAVQAAPAIGGLGELALKAALGACVYASAATALNVAGARGAVSGLWQRVCIKLGVPGSRIGAPPR